ncbi:hypothetical protein C8F04DRAFT_1194283 [Mycena alexandri]|uniref:Uncharacterized protein n=1 Tax=Mycena alexandri TaxID=1745969 RepID=A0AAD6WRK6_9AGAR|nr:hypothetical protein C8F04DRAFT_1194283 [Mycena alexandri]
MTAMRNTKEGGPEEFHLFDYAHQLFLGPGQVHAKFMTGVGHLINDTAKVLHHQVHTVFTAADVVEPAILPALSILLKKNIKAAVECRLRAIGIQTGKSRDDAMNLAKTRPVTFYQPCSADGSQWRLWKGGTQDK